VKCLADNIDQCYWTVIVGDLGGWSPLYEKCKLYEIPEVNNIQGETEITTWCQAQKMLINSHCVSVKSLDSDYDAATDNCMNIKAAAGCRNLASKCQWIPKDSTPVIKPTGPTPLFTKEFCHPVAITSTTSRADFGECMSQDNAADCTNNASSPCIWSKGLSLIPQENFCAPANITDDINEILTCI